MTSNQYILLFKIVQIIYVAYTNRFGMYYSYWLKRWSIIMQNQSHAKFRKPNLVLYFKSDDYNLETFCLEWLFIINYVSTKIFIITSFFDLFRILKFIYFLLKYY